MKTKTSITIKNAAIKPLDCCGKVLSHSKECRQSVENLQKSSWIQTFTGKKLYPLEPDINLICIEDIAHSLAMQCRFNGHTKQFYSVAQHSVLMANNFGDEELAQYALLHDASEAYLSDVPRPLKQLPEFDFYRRAELHLQTMIYRRFGLDSGEPKAICKADAEILGEESVWLMLPLHKDWDIFGFGIYNGRETWQPKIAEEKFLELFYELFGDANERNFIV